MSRRILVVDDEQSLRELVEFRLEFKGYQVDSASNGEEALAKTAQFLPDLVVLDVMMPGLNGLEVCKRLKSAHKGVKVLMLSAKGGVNDQEAGLAAGADCYLSKPFRAGVLLAEIDKLLEA